MDDLTREFLLESYENLDRLDQEFVKLETEPGNLELLKSIFRTIHTIKGTCGFLGFTKLEAVAHAGESLLSVLRDGHLKLNSEIVTALLQMVDAVRQMLTSIDTTGNEGERDDEELIANLARLLKPKVEAVEEAAPVVEEKAVKSEEVQPDTSIGEILIKKRVAKVIDVQDAVLQQQEGDPRHIGEILVEKGAVTPQDVLEALNLQQQARTAGTSESTIRVDVSQLDRLMNRVGELVLLRNQILQYTNTTDDSGLVATSQRLNLITTELQEGVMKTRMQPIGNIWSKFPRTVRDVAMSCGKKVRIEMEGKETELDKTIIEAIKDPLTHIVRNSVDHGIETPAERIAAGKPVEGTLLLRAYHEGGQVNIEISDDGAGLDLEKIRRKAVEKGAITTEHASRMSERETANLIFLPGLSTAEKVTNVSGRGVGMDVVRTNIDKIGGIVDVQSKLGLGTTVRMKIPLTLAIIPALIVTNRGDRYAIPQISLLELVRLEGEEAQKRIESVQGAPVYRLRERLLPLVYLDYELRPEETANLKNKSAVVNIVVLQADERQFGLVVDEINDTEEIVVKPLGKQLKGIKSFAGAAIMGDGRVALILDVLGLAQSANVVSESREHATSSKEAGAEAESSQKQTMLLLQCGAEGRLAMELSLVARLEEFRADAIERTGEQLVVQYRGEIMPLVYIADALRLPHCESAAQNQSGKTQVVVYSEEGRRVGLVVDRILDIVEESFVRQQPAKREGLFGSAVIQQKVTDLLDVHSLVRNAIPTFFEVEPICQER
jgi:two-component system, chemotaxis family, sensor kinase CheA